MRSDSVEHLQKWSPAILGSLESDNQATATCPPTFPGFARDPLTINLQKKVQEVSKQRKYCENGKGSRRDALLSNLIILFRLLIFYHGFGQGQLWAEISHDWGVDHIGSLHLKQIAGYYEICRVNWVVKRSDRPPIQCSPQFKLLLKLIDRYTQLKGGRSDEPYDSSNDSLSIRRFKWLTIRQKYSTHLLNFDVQDHDVEHLCSFLDSKQERLSASSPAVKIVSSSVGRVEIQTLSPSKDYKKTPTRPKEPEKKDTEAEGEAGQMKGKKKCTERSKARKAQAKTEKKNARKQKGQQQKSETSSPACEASQEGDFLAEEITSAGQDESMLPEDPYDGLREMAIKSSSVGTCSGCVILTRP